MAAGSSDKESEPPFQGGAQPVPEHPPEMPKAGRSVMQVIVIAIGVLTVLAGLLWILVPALGAR
ncbi:MAG: hypothetical protein H0X65_07015 [Gemmatimonadetes bacterium]|nr:hypothetical protein [Gemmatimonadota bacterium]